MYADMSVGRNPFLWESGSREAVLCIHGFTGAPGVFRKLGRVLQEEGLTVYACRLPGHGTIPEDLAYVTAGQFISAVEQSYANLASAYDRVHIVGLSMGGALATILAARHAGDSSLGCVSLLSPGYGFNKVLAARLKLDTWTDSPENDGKMIPIPSRKPKGDEMDECIFGYSAVPYSIFGQVLELNAAARDAQACVTAPVMLLYTEADLIVDAEACAWAAGVFTHLEEVHGFKKSEHNLLLGCDRDETILRCSSFIKRHRL